MSASAHKSSSPTAGEKKQKSKQAGGVLSSINQYNSDTKPNNSILEANKIDPDHVTANVKKNSKGGILVTGNEIENAFAFLDLEKQGTVNMATLKKRLGVFFPEMTAKDLRFLLNNKKDICIEDLNALLLDNEITNFDPVAEAFKSFDTKGEGSISIKKLREVFVAFGLGELSNDETDILIKAADIDGDGIIGLEDFRKLIDSSNFEAVGEKYKKKEI